MVNLQQIKECPDCASSNIVHNLKREQIICRECGLIYEPLTPVEERIFEKTHHMVTKPAKPAKKKAKKVKKPKAKAKKKKKR